jgi:hypothetical protein
VIRRTTMPLAAASARPRGKPGRPRTVPPAPPRVEPPLAMPMGAQLQPRLLDTMTWSVRCLHALGREPRPRS